MQQHQFPTALIEFEGNGFLVSRHGEGDIIKTFSSKQELVKYVKTVLNEEEQCKIVINSSKPKAVYFQCERSGSFRTTVKDASKRQRVAYTKRSKCGYRLVANLYPPDKDKAKKMKKEAEFEGYPGEDDKKDLEMWILRMIHPAHNHPPEPNFTTGGGGKKKRAKYTRTLVEKPLNRTTNGTAAAVAAVAGYPDALLHDHQLLQQQHYLQQQQQQQLHHLQQQQHHAHHGQHHHDDGNHPSVQDVAVIAAMEAAPGNHSLLNPPVDPNIDSVDPNVDPSVQQHDHAHGHVLSLIHI